MHTAATLFQKLCYENKDALSAGIIVAGWDKEVGPSVYNIPLGGGLFRQPWAIGGTFLFNRFEYAATHCILVVFQARDLHMYMGTAMLHTKKDGMKNRLSISSRTVRFPNPSFFLQD